MGLTSVTRTIDDLAWIDDRRKFGISELEKGKIIRSGARKELVVFVEKEEFVVTTIQMFDKGNIQENSYFLVPDKNEKYHLKVADCTIIQTKHKVCQHYKDYLKYLQN